MTDVTPPPELVIRRLELRHPWRIRFFFILLWLASLVACAWIVSQTQQFTEPDSKLGSTLAATQKEIETLRRQVVVLERSEQIVKIASAELQQTLRDRQEEIAGLRADLEFYSRLTGGNSKRESLLLHSVHLKPVVNSHAFNFTVTLTQNLKKGQIVTGRIRISAEGIQQQKLITLPWSELAQGQDSKGIEFGFKYFQRVEGTMILPTAFIPNRIKITAEMPGENNRIEQEFSWADILTNKEIPDVQ